MREGTSRRTDPVCPRCNIDIHSRWYSPKSGICEQCGARLEPIYIDALGIVVYLAIGTFFLLVVCLLRTTGEAYAVALGLCFLFAIVGIPICWKLIEHFCFQRFAEAKATGPRQFSLVQALYVIFLMAVYLCMFFGQIDDILPAAIGAYCLWGVFETAQYFSIKRAQREQT